MTRLFSWYASDPLFAWFTLLQILSFMILGITLAIGTRLSIKQSRQMVALETELTNAKKDLSDSKTKQAEAERRLLELQNRVSWRSFKDHKFREALQGTAKGKVQIVYKRDDDEAYILAGRIYSCLRDSKWDAEQPMPSKDNPESPFPFGLREAGAIGSNSPVLSIVASSEDLTDTGNFRQKPVAALIRAFVESTGQTPATVSVAEVKVPEGVIRIAVGGRL